MYLGVFKGYTVLEINCRCVISYIDSLDSTKCVKKMFLFQGYNLDMSLFNIERMGTKKRGKKEWKQKYFTAYIFIYLIFTWPFNSVIETKGSLGQIISQDNVYSVIYYLLWDIFLCRLVHNLNMKSSCYEDTLKIYFNNYHSSIIFDPIEIKRISFLLLVLWITKGIGMNANFLFPINNSKRVLFFK